MAATVVSGSVAGSDLRRTTAEPVRDGATKAGWRAAAFVAAAPLLVHILGLVLVRPQIVLGGDQALIELAVRDATRFHATVGDYSHFGWHHPGPAWLYLLSLPYRTGAAPWSLVASVLLLNVVWLALIVRTASRLPRRAAEGTRASWLVALALLALLWSLGTDTFRYVWNPNATILPAVLFLVLCCGVLLRRRGCALGAALVGTFLVQTHVGTVALVGGVGLFVLLARMALPRGRHPGRVGAPASRRLHRGRRQAITVAGILLLVLAWVPPVVDQVTGTRNLSKIFDFFVRHQEPRSWSGSISGPGELVDRVFLHRGTNRLTPPLHLAGTAGIVTMAVLLAAAMVLVAAGRGRSRAAQACGIVAVVAVPPAVVAAHGIVGDAGPYLLFWVLAIPVLIAVGWAHFLAAGHAQERRPAAALVWAGLAVATVGAAAALVVHAADIPAAPPPADAAIGRGAPLLAQRLEPLGHQPVLVTISSARRWAVATGLALEMTRRGWPAYLAGAKAAMFDLAPPSGRTPRVEIVVADVSAPAVRGATPVTPPGSPPLGLYVRTARG